MRIKFRVLLLREFSEKVSHSFPFSLRKVTYLNCKKMAKPLEIGEERTETFTVVDSDSAAAYGSGMAPVLSTPRLIGMIESVALHLLEDGHMKEGEGSVGASISVNHKAATPIGMTVTVKVKITAIEGRKVVFEAVAHDQCDEIADGSHTRFIIDNTRFMARVNKKAALIPK